MTHERHRKKQRPIYIPPDMDEIMEAVEIEAKKTKRGIGYLLLSAYAIQHGLPVPEYKTRAEKGAEGRWKESR